METDFRGNNEYRLEDGPDRLTRIRPECFIDDYIGGWGFVRREVRSAKPFGNDDIFKEIVDFVNELDRLMYGLSPCIGHAFFGAYAHGLTRGPIYDFMKGQYKDEVPGSFDGITFFPAFSPFTNEYYPLDISASVRANYLEKEKLWILRLNCKFEVSFARKDRMQAIVD
ncbi:MAG TPA: hypothetical protein PKD64_19790 [Pirellulaceae bacterium]|nr:hypothetical protein [Pirellulaceae bacterium]